jgi:predicted DNA-binding protein with PD1-like motif
MELHLRAVDVQSTFLTSAGIVQELDLQFSPSKFSHRMGPSEVISAHCNVVASGMQYTQPFLTLF